MLRRCAVADEKWQGPRRVLYLGTMILRCSTVMLCCACWWGCAGDPPPSAADTSATSGGETAAISADANAELTALEAPATTPEVEPRQGDVIDGGVIPRARLQAVVDAGIPTFLQSVRTEPHKEGARFVGWRLLSVFDDASFAHGPLRIGDTVLGVNGRTIERPEQFFAVWETLATATEITFQLLRAGQAYEVHYVVHD